MAEPEHAGKGLLSTLLWTNLVDAIKADFPELADMDLRRAGKATTAVLREMAETYLSAQESTVSFDENMPPLTFLYENHRGEVARRVVAPRRIVFMKSDWYPTPAWFLQAHDLEKDKPRDFALMNIVRFTR